MPAPATFDVGLDSDGDLPVRSQHISGLDLVVQRIGRRLRTVKGEWFADVSEGLPYRTWLATKSPDAAGIGALIRKAIEATPQVVRVDDWTSAWDAADRRLTFGGTIRTLDGDLSASVAPFGFPGSGNRNAAFRMLIHTGRIAPPP